MRYRGRPQMVSNDSFTAVPSLGSYMGRHPRAQGLANRSATISFKIDASFHIVYPSEVGNQLCSRDGLATIICSSNAGK